MASVRVLTEDETAGGIYSLLVATLKNAKDKGLLDNEDLVSGGEERLVIYGLALLLSCPDFKLETTSPGIALPRPSESNRRLDALTCPTEFRPYFDRWAELASRLKTLSDKHAQDLALLICKKSPVTLTEQLPDPYPFFPTSEQKALREIRDLSSEISTISHAISTHASFSSLWVGKLGAALSEAPPSSNSQALAVVGHSMKTSEVLTILSQHNCPNISSDLDAASCSKNPILSDGLHSTYSGKLCDGKQVAVKVVFAYTNKKREQLIRTARELYPWSKCRHPHIVQLLGLAEFRNRTAMIFPWMDNGDIRNYVNKHPDADKFNLIHGDIRGFNVLVSKEGSAMLSGFRTSIVQESTVQFTSEQKIKYGALRWTQIPSRNPPQAPELIKEKPDNISRATDVYALGMTILEILTGEAPYSQYPNEFACLRAALDGKLPDRPLKQIPVDGDWGNMVWALLINCWKREPKERPTAEHVHKNLKPSNIPGREAVTETSTEVF
ncbi:hypothetical protein FRC07_013631 [Ceratobasidium sp. 392]|nr:hypothetical protein FRC07_013631 [Ceratobasidium sp. 392]